MIFCSNVSSHTAKNRLFINVIGLITCLSYMEYLSVLELRFYFLLLRSCFYMKV